MEGEEGDFDAGESRGRDSLLDLEDLWRRYVNMSGLGVVVDKHGNPRDRLGHGLVMGEDLIVVVRVIVGRDQRQGIDPESGAMPRKINRRIGVGPPNLG